MQLYFDSFKTIHFLRRSGSFLMLMLLCASMLLLSGCKEGDYFFFYLVKNEAPKAQGDNRLEYFKDEKFDADKIVNDIWDDQVIPAIREKAVNLSTLLEEWEHGQDETGRHYGYREEGGDYPWNFLVKMDGRVVAVNTKSRKGTMSLDLPPYDGTSDMTVWIGPIITSYSIRDALNFISFTTGVKSVSGTQYKFDTQVQFSELSNSLNRRGNQNVLAVLKPQMCFALTDASFEEFKKNNMPDAVIEKLNSLKNQACTLESQFGDTVKNLLGTDAGQYQELVLKYADASETAKGKTVRVYGAITPQKAKEITPALLEFIEEGQS